MKSLAFFVFLAIFPLQRILASPDVFNVSGFEYPETRLEIDSSSEGEDNIQEDSEKVPMIPSGNSGGMVNIFMGDLRTGKDIADEKPVAKTRNENGDTLRFITHISYWTTQNSSWHGRLMPVIALGVSLGFPKAKSSIFSFSTEASLDYRLSLGRGDASLALNSIELKVPLVFSFSFGSVSELSIVLSAFYEHIFLNINTLFEDPRLYNHNQAGIAAGMRYVYRLSDILDLGMSFEYEFPIKEDSFDLMSAGVILIWRAL